MPDSDNSPTDTGLPDTATPADIAFSKLHGLIETASGVSGVPGAVLYQPSTTTTPGEPGSEIILGAPSGISYLINSDNSVPEPGAYPLLSSLGLAGVAFLGRRRTR